MAEKRKWIKKVRASPDAKLPAWGSAGESPDGSGKLAQPSQRAVRAAKMYRPKKIQRG